jgi:DNA-directed RNA polymerase specialized sigma24 family protein
MSELTAHKAKPKSDWTLNPRAFDRLLNWLDHGMNSDGQKYLEMRQRLVAYFDRKNCPAPDELADETLNRIARRLEEEGIIESETPARYCYIVARFVFMEHLRRMQKGDVPLDDLQRGHDPAAPEAGDEKEIKEKMLNCLEHCTSKLESSSHKLIIRYYKGQERVKIENRRALAEELGITVNALSIRACRIRDRLEACVTECLGEE